VPRFYGFDVIETQILRLALQTIERSTVKGMRYEYFPAHLGLASEARSTGGDPPASQARQRSTGGDPFGLASEATLLVAFRLLSR
jgi:hypothetical protein